MTDDLHIEVTGTGARTVVGLHGWNGSTRSFDDLVEAMPEDSVRFVAVDLPGYGRSAPPVDWSLETIAAGVVAALDEAGIANFDILGSCSGTVVGLYVAEHAAERVDRLIALEPFAFLPGYLRIFLTPVLGTIAYWSSFENPIGRRITNVALAGKRDEQTDMLAAFDERGGRIPLRWLEMFDHAGPPERFASLACDKTIVVAENTFTAVMESVDLLRTIWPDAHVTSVDGAGHLLLQERPTAIATVVATTMQRSAGSSFNPLT